MNKRTIRHRILMKLTSSKFILTTWSCSIISYIVIADKASYNNIAMALTAVVLSYFVVNEVQKHINNK